MDGKNTRREYRFRCPRDLVDAAALAAGLSGFSRDHKAIVYGAGHHGKELGEYLETRGFTVKCFCDANPEKQRRLYYGKPVVSPEELCRSYRDHTVVVSVFGHGEAIRHNLMAGGTPAENIYLPTFRRDLAQISVPESLVPSECAADGEFSIEEFPTASFRPVASVAPRVTVYSKIYNIQEAYLRRAIESILKQTFPDFKYILHDNGSTDGSAGIIDEYAALDKRIVVFRTEKNYRELRPKQILDTKVQINTMIDTPYFALLDSDDYYEPDFLETTLRIADAEGADIVAGCTAWYWEKTPHVVRSTPAPIGEGIYRGRGQIAGMLSDFYFIWRVMWAKLMRADIYRETAITPHPVGIGSAHDSYEAFVELSMADTVVMTDRIIHGCTVRDISISRNLEEQYCHFERNYILYQQWLRFLADSGALSDKNIAAAREEICWIMRSETQHLSKLAEEKPGQAKEVLDRVLPANWFADMRAIPEFGEVLAVLEEMRGRI